MTSSQGQSISKKTTEKGGVPFREGAKGHYAKGTTEQNCWSEVLCIRNKKYTGMKNRGTRSQTLLGLEVTDRLWFYCKWQV